MRSFAELEQALRSRTNYERTRPPPGGWGLDRMARLLAALDHPERAYGVVHVAGTAGKGTTCAGLASTLDAAGLRVGLTTSPHLIHLRERIRIGAEPAPEALWLASAQRVLDAADGLDTPPTYFELVMAMAFEAFRAADVDVAVVETGLGGRLDASNLVPQPLLSIITRIGFDHMALLGETLAEIAAEKAGIVKQDRPVLAAPGSPEAEAVIAARCEELSAPLTLLGRDAQVSARRAGAANAANDPAAADDPSAPAKPTDPATADDPAARRPTRSRIVVRAPWGEHDLETPLPTALCANVALIVLAAQALEVQLARPILRHVERGLKRLTWRARFDVLGDHPLLIADGAHEPASLNALVDTYQSAYPERSPVIVLGIAADKRLQPVLEALARLRPRQVVCTAYANPRSLNPDELAAHCSAAGLAAQSSPNAEHALGAAERLARAGSSPILVTGSLILAGEVLAICGASADAAWDGSR